MNKFNSSRQDPFSLSFHSGEDETVFEIPPNAREFDGHFDGHPIAPGALLLDWMFRRAEADGITDAASALTRSRFTREVTIGNKVTVRSRPDRRGLVVEVLANDEVAARSWFSRKQQ